MDKHFCTCMMSGCEHHPGNHSEGCDPCIKKNLKNGEIPTCFWFLVSDNFEGVNSFYIEDFVKFYSSRKGMDAPDDE